MFIHSIRINFLCVLLLVGSFSNELWADQLKDIIDSNRQTIASWLTPDRTQSLELSLNDIKDYPMFYHTHRVTEPVFNNPLFYMETGSPDNPPILLIHGLGQSASKDWLKVIPELAKSYHVFAIDLPGFGLSKGPYFEYSPQNYSQVIHWFIASIISTKPILMGHSMGGAISLFFAASYPQTIERLVLVDAAGILERASFIKHLAQLPKNVFIHSKIWKRIDSELRNFSNKWVEKSGEFYDPTKLLDKNELLRQLLLQDSHEMNAALAMIDTNFSTLRFDKIPLTTLIWGEKDPIAPLRTGQALLAKLPKAKLEIIANAEHVPMNSHHTEFNRILLANLLSPINSEISTSSNSLSKRPGPLNSQRIAKCKDDDNPKFSGDYHSIHMKNCKLAVLQDVRVTHFSSKESFIQIYNSQVGSFSSVTNFNASAIIATGSNFYGKIVSENSRLDFAAVKLQSRGHSLEALDTTKLIFSISEIKSAYFSGPLHGYYSLKKGTLESQLIDD